MPSCALGSDSHFYAWTLLRSGADAGGAGGAREWMPRPRVSPKILAFDAGTKSSSAGAAAEFAMLMITLCRAPLSPDLECGTDHHAGPLLLALSRHSR